MGPKEGIVCDWAAMGDATSTPARSMRFVYQAVLKTTMMDLAEALVMEIKTHFARRQKSKGRTLPGLNFSFSALLISPEGIW